MTENEARLNEDILQTRLNILVKREELIDKRSRLLDMRLADAERKAKPIKKKKKVW